MTFQATLNHRAYGLHLFLYFFFKGEACILLEYTEFLTMEVGGLLILVLFFFFFSFYFTLQYCIGFGIHWHESATGVHALPTMNPPPHLPSHIIPLDHPHAPAPSILHPASCIEHRLVIRLFLMERKVFLFPWELSAIPGNKFCCHKCGCGCYRHLVGRG